MIVHGLHRRAGLLVLGNCEHVFEGAAGLASAVADRCPDVVVLATSRERLGLVDGRLVPLAPLDPAGPGAELFAERAAAVSPTFDLDTERSAVEEICRRLDGLPLAIELAAARTATLTTADIVARLGDRLRLLDARRRGAEPRQQTLRAALQWSVDLLTPEDRESFAALSVFAGPFDTTAAHAVIDDRRDPVEVEDVLAGLTERSLLTVEHDEDGHAHWMLETIRELGREMLVRTGRADAVHVRHTQWCLQQVDRAAVLLAGEEELAGVALVVAVWPELRAAFQRACARGDVDLADRLLRPVAPELGMRLRLEIGEWAEDILDLLPTGDERTSYWLLWATQRHQELGDGAAITRLVDRHGHADSPLIRHAMANLSGDGDELAATSETALAVLREQGLADLAEWMQVVGVAAGLLRGGRLQEHDDLLTGLLNGCEPPRRPTIRHWASFMLGYSALFADEEERAQMWFDAAAAIEIPPGTISANGPARARAALRAGDADGAAAILHDHVIDLLDADANLVATRLVGVGVVAITAARGRLTDTARMLGHLDTTVGFGEQATGSVVAEAARAVDASDDPAVVTAREEGRRMDHLEVLEWVRGLPGSQDLRWV